MFCDKTTAKESKRASVKICREAHVENRKIGTYNPARGIMGNHQLIIITRLLQVVETMKNIDELFEWLSEMIVQRMDVQVVHFWAMQAYMHERVSCELRSMACQSALLPHHIVLNQTLANIVEQLFNKRQNVTPRQVSNVFSQYYSKLLMRYDLNYWACHFMSNTTLLPPTRDDPLDEKIATPLTLGVTVFLQRQPSARLVPTLAHILEHVLPIARSRGLLEIKPPTKQELQLTTRQYTGKHLELTESTHHHHVQADHTTKRTSIDGSIIQDKNARRLYLAIDGHKSISELALVVQMNMREFYAALSLLLMQKRVQVSEPEERNSAGASFLQSSLIPRIT